MSALYKDGYGIIRRIVSTVEVTEEKIVAEIDELKQELENLRNLNGTAAPAEVPSPTPAPTPAPVAPTEPVTDPSQVTPPAPVLDPTAPTNTTVPAPVQEPAASAPVAPDASVFPTN